MENLSLEAAHSDQRSRVPTSNNNNNNNKISVFIDLLIYLYFVNKIYLVSFQDSIIIKMLTFPFFLDCVQF